MQYPAQVMQSIINATAVTQSPLSPPAQRSEAVAFFEQLKRGDVHILVQAASALLAPQYQLEVQITALTLLHGVVKLRWQELSSNEQAQMGALAMQCLTAVGGLGDAGWALRSKSAALLAVVARQQGPQGIPQLSEPLLKMAEDGPVQAELACLTWHFIAEDLTQYEEATGEMKRKLLQALTAAIPTLFPFFTQMLATHFQRAVEMVQAGNRQAAQAHASVLRAALSALSAFVDWAPLGRISAFGVVQAAAFFMQTEEFRLEAVDIMRQITARKRGNDPYESYCELMAATADALMASAAGVLDPAASPLLDFQRPLEEFGLRLCRTMVALAEGHMRCVSTPEKRLVLLQQLVAFTRHPFLLLSSEPLNLWNRMLREAADASATPNGLKAPPKAAAAAQDGAGAGQGPDAGPVMQMPPELCQELLVVLGQQLMRVGHEDDSEVPQYFDDHQDFKEFCNRVRGSIKTAVKSAAQLAPRQALECCARLLGTTLQRCSQADAGTVERHVLVEAAVHYLESVLPAVSEGPPSSDGAVLAAIEALMQQLLTLRIADPTILSLQGRGLEVFAKFLLLRPAMALPVIEAVLGLMALLPLPGPGQQPPPPRMTPEMRDNLSGRMNLAKVLLNMARVAPQAFAPHLQAIVGRLQELWQQGQLMEGERVNLAEGLLAAASALGPEVQSQALEWLLGPLATHWAEPGFLADTADPRSFAARYMPLEAAPDGAAAIGGREARWSLYHELAMLERSIRRTSSSTSGRDSPGAPSSHPLNRHLAWMAPPVARVVTCLHGLWEPQMQAAMAPVIAAFRLDPMERALLLNEDRDIAKAKQLEEPASVAGSTAAGLRHWLRGVRDTCYAVLGLLGTHCPALWDSTALAPPLVQAAVSSMEHMELRHLRMLLRHVVLHWLSRCPPPARAAWVLPLMSVLLPHLYRSLPRQWQEMLATGAGAAAQRESAAEAGDEVVRETMLRSTTREYLAVLVKITERPGQDNRPPSPGKPARPDAGEVEMRGAPASPDEESLLELLLRVDPATALAAVAGAVTALEWPDGDTTRKAVAVCRVVVQLSNAHTALAEVSAGQMLRSAVTSLTLVSTTMNHAEVVALIRVVLASHMAAARPVLLSLPNVTPQVLSNFEAALNANHSEKAQRDVIKALLIEAGGDAMRALANVGPPGAVTNVPEPKHRPSDDGDPLQLPDLF